MLTLRDILLGVAAPFVVSAILVCTAMLISRRRIAGGALAVGVGFALGCILVFGWPGIRPVNDFDWVIPIAVLAGVVGTFAEVLHWRRAWAWGGLAALLAWLLIHSQVEPAAIAGVMAAGWLWWCGWDGLLKRSSGAWAGVVMTGVAGFSSLILMLSDSQRIGQLGLAVVGSIGAIWLIGWWTKNHRLWRGAGFSWGVVLFGLLLDGKFWAGLTWTNAVLLAVAPLLPWLAEFPPLHRLTGWRLAIVRIVLVVIPVVIALILAIFAFQHAQQSTGGDYY